MTEHEQFSALLFGSNLTCIQFSNAFQTHLANNVFGFQALNGLSLQNRFLSSVYMVGTTFLELSLCTTRTSFRRMKAISILSYAITRTIKIQL